jgi:hypothetical protein
MLLRELAGDYALVLFLIQIPVQIKNVFLKSIFKTLHEIHKYIILYYAQN